MKFLMLVLVLFVASCGKPVPTGRIIERAKDPVCGMWVEKNKDLFPLVAQPVYDGALYYFCCNECALTFANNPTKYATACDCSKTNHNCTCPHCQGKQEPCDCKK